MSTRDRLWATVAIWVGTTIILTSFLTGPAVSGIAKKDLVGTVIVVPFAITPLRVNVVGVVAVVAIAAAIGTATVWWGARPPDRTQRS